MNRRIWKPWVKVGLFLAGALLIFLALNTASDFLSTLDRLKIVEVERDQWQRPSEILRALDLRQGNVVVDLGSGAGYFTLKLAPIVGSSGKVVAVDIRKVSLLFLGVRALWRPEHNISIIVGEEDNPHLPAGSADSILICNTYHEFHDRPLILDYAFKALHPGGRLVIVDRERGVDQHGIAAASVEDDLRHRGFEILSREEPFINRPGDDPWWLIVAETPHVRTSAEHFEEAGVKQ